MKCLGMRWIGAGHLAIVEFLAGITEMPIAPDNYGYTSIHETAMYGHLDVTKFLVDLTDMPIVPNNNGETPIELARMYEHDEVKEFLHQYVNNPQNKAKSQRTWGKWYHVLYCILNPWKIEYFLNKYY